MNNIARKPKKDKYLKLVYTTIKPKSMDIINYHPDIDITTEYKRQLIIRKVLLEDNDSYYYKFKNKMERAAKNTVEVISLYS